MKTFKQLINEAIQFDNEEEFDGLPLSASIREGKVKNGSKKITDQSSIIVVCDYPLDGEYEFTLKSSGGFTKQQFYSKLRDLYSTIIYKNANKYGIWGHSIRDLSLESVSIRGGKYYPNIGS